MWSVAYFGKVYRAEEELQDIVRLYVPRGVKITRPRNKHKPVESHYPLFGNMMFFEFSVQNVRLVKSVRGFKKFIRMGRSIAVCRDEEIQRIRTAETNGEFRYDYNSDNKTIDEKPFIVGEEVAIINTKNFNENGTITQVTGNKLKLLVPGWNYELTLDSCNVSHIDI